MRRLLARYPSPARRETIVTWALDEPEEILPAAGTERERIFGDARLALMYSGSFGRAHSADAILDLLDILEPRGVRMAFCIRGNRADELKQAAAERQLDMRFPGFARTEELAGRSASADVHVVSLNREWTGTVVPSKFFGALAAGRPVLFCGSAGSALACWIEEFHVGWVLHDGNTPSIADQLLAYAASPAQQKEMQERCFCTYHAHFSRRIQIGKWNSIIRSVLSDQPTEHPAWVDESPVDTEEESPAASIPSRER
jgi:glycosyltransferase involved in cell wall biosynthesis